jgi:hypothetical protein
MQSVEESAALYLQQIQPRHLADLVLHIQHDLLMLLGSYASYFELFETHLKTIKLSDDIAAHYHTGLRTGINNSYLLLNEMVSGLQSIDASLAYEWMRCVIHDLRSPIGVFRGWAELFQDEFRMMQTSPFVKPVEHLNQAMQSTADRMYVITTACAEYVLRLEKQE